MVALILFQVKLITGQISTVPRLFYNIKINYQNIWITLVIKYLKKIIKNRINNRFIDVFDGNDKELVELKNIILFGPYGIPLTSNFKIIYSSLGTIEFAKKRIQYTIKEIGVFKIVLEIIKVKYFQKNQDKQPIGFLIPRAGWPSLPNYGHYVCEDLPKIKIYREWEKINKCKLKLLVSPNSERKWVDEYLELFEYSKSDIKHHEKIVKKIPKLIMAKLYYIHSYSFQSNPVGIKWVASVLKNIVIDEELEVRKNIYISRQNVYRRKIINYDVLSHFLEKYNFISIDPGDYSVKEQIKLFSNANIIAGQSGAAYANMIYATDATIIFLWNEMEKINCWQNLSNDLDFNYIPVKTRAVNGQNNSKLFNDLEIDAEHFDEIVTNVLSKTA